MRDTLDTEGISRLIESVPSPKAKPFKLWITKLCRQELVTLLYIDFLSIYI